MMGPGQPRQGQGRPPMRGGAPPADQTMESMRSPLNPTDMAAMQEQGPPIDPNQTTVREVLAMQGIDVDGPVSQLVKFSRKQMQNADMGNKMQAMGQSAPAPNPMDQKMGGGGQPAPPPDDPMAQLMGG